MPETSTIILIAGISLLLVMFVRKAIRKAKERGTNPPARQTQVTVVERKESVKRVNAQWRAMGYFFGLAALGNLYSAFLFYRKALPTMSTVYWLDAGLSLLAALSALLLWKKRSQDFVVLYAAWIIIQVMFNISINEKLVAIIHSFPLLLVYLAVKPVWKDLE